MDSIGNGIIGMVLLVNMHKNNDVTVLGKKKHVKNFFANFRILLQLNFTWFTLIWPTATTSRRPSATRTTRGTLWPSWPFSSTFRMKIIITLIRSNQVAHLLSNHLRFYSLCYTYRLFEPSNPDFAVIKKFQLTLFK